MSVDQVVEVRSLLSRYRVFIFVFVLVGPEMTQDERAEEAEQAMEFERLRAQGVSLREIGISRAKGEKLGSDEQVGDGRAKESVELKEEA